MLTQPEKLPLFLTNSEASTLAGVSPKTMLKAHREGTPSPFTDNHGVPVEPRRSVNARRVPWRWPTEALLQALEMTEGAAAEILNTAQTNP